MKTKEKYRYFLVSPRGFVNEVVIYRVPLEKVAECEAEYQHMEDETSGYCYWTKPPRHKYGAIDWADRNW